MYGAVLLFRYEHYPPILLFQEFTNRINLTQISKSKYIKLT